MTLTLQDLMRDAVVRPSDEELERLSKLDRPLFIKAGFDPTRPDLHLGHAVLLRKLRQFQDAGHEVVLVVGDFTAMVGDPTGRNTARPKLTREEVLVAAETYRQQAFKFLLPERTYTRFNSQWYDSMTAADLVQLASMGTVAQMIERADFSQRFEGKQPIYLHEFLYPLLQGWDSVNIAREFDGRCDIELGGSDQLFNLLVGRALMSKEGLAPQAVMTMPLLEGTDAKLVDGRVTGPKMSKTLGNSIGLNDSPDDIFHRVMLIDDAAVSRFTSLLTNWGPRDESPKELKVALAMELVTKLHSEDAAIVARAKRETVAGGLPPDDVETLEVPIGGMRLSKFLFEACLATSNSDGMRFIAGGAVRLDGVVVRDPQMVINPTEIPILVRVGSKTRRFVWAVGVGNSA